MSASMTEVGCASPVHACETEHCAGMPKELDDYDRALWLAKWHQPWKQGEIEFLRWLWARRVPVWRIVRDILRSEDAIYMMAHRLGLIERVPDYEAAGVQLLGVRDIAARFHVHPGTALDWLNKGRLRGRLIAHRGKSKWLVEESEVRSFERREMFYLDALSRAHAMGRTRGNWASRFNHKVGVPKQ